MRWNKGKPPADGPTEDQWSASGRSLKRGVAPRVANVANVAMRVANVAMRVADLRSVGHRIANSVWKQYNERVFLSNEHGVVPSPLYPAPTKAFTFNPPENG